MLAVVGTVIVTWGAPVVPDSVACVPAPEGVGVVLTGRDWSGVFPLPIKNTSAITTTASIPTIMAIVTHGLSQGSFLCPVINSPLQICLMICRLWRNEILYCWDTVLAWPRLPIKNIRYQDFRCLFSGL